MRIRGPLLIGRCHVGVLDLNEGKPIIDWHSFPYAYLRERQVMMNLLHDWMWERKLLWRIKWEFKLYLKSVETLGSWDAPTNTTTNR